MSKPRAGFTLLEFLVAIGILAILIAIIIPYILRAREMSHRVECAAHLQTIGQALAAYSHDQGASFALPETVYDAAHKPRGYVCFTGPDDPHPFAKDGAVKPNDITASLWLLVRGGYVKDPAVFICPSTADEPDRLTDAAGNPVSALKRGNFRAPQNLSYSYASPFTDAYDFAFSIDRLPSEFAIVADKNPGIVSPDRFAPPFELARGNSPNHQQAGENVLHPAGDVSFEPTPYCGVSHDDIYTVLAERRLAGTHPPLDGPGYIGPNLGPAYNYDSYLVPTAQDKAP